MVDNDFDFNDFSDLEETATPITPSETPATQQAQPTPQKKRIRATKNMVSIRYRLKNFWKNAGIEMLLLILLFFSLRHILFTDVTNKESRGLISTGVQITEGKLNLSSSLKSKDFSTVKYNHAFSATLPIAAVTAISSGGRTIYLLLSIFLSIATLFFIYNIARQLFSAEAGIIACAIFILFPGILLKSGGVYTLNFCFFYFFLGLLLFLIALKKSSITAFLFAGFFAAAACYAKATGFVLLTAFPTLLISTKSKNRKTLFFFAGLLLFILSTSILQTLVFKGKILQEFSAFFAWQKTANTPTPGNIYISLGRVFQQIFLNGAILPFTLLSLIAVGYTLRTSSSSFSHFPILFLGGTFLMLEFFPINLSPYTTLAQKKALLNYFAPAVSLLSGAFIAGITNRETIRWFLITAALLSAPLLFLF